MHQPPDRIEKLSNDRTSLKALSYDAQPIVNHQEMTEIVIRSGAPATAIEAQPVKASESALAVVPPRLHELVRLRLVQAPWYQNIVDTTLRLDPSDGQKLREHVSNDTVPPEDFRSGKSGFQYALLSISQRKPYLLVGGMLAWSYTLVYWAMKLTFLV